MKMYFSRGVYQGWGGMGGSYGWGMCVGTLLGPWGPWGGLGDPKSVFFCFLGVRGGPGGGLGPPCLPYRGLLLVGSQ